MKFFVTASACSDTRSFGSKMGSKSRLPERKASSYVATRLPALKFRAPGFQSVRSFTTSISLKT
jgi:hypothetical protein